MNYRQEILDLPIGSFLDNIVQKLINSPSKFLILTAQTAAGKSTGIPFALINKADLWLSNAFRKLLK